MRPADSFPADGQGESGFRNDSGGLFLAPLLAEKYLEAAGDIVEALIETWESADTLDVRLQIEDFLLTETNHEFREYGLDLRNYQQTVYRYVVSARKRPKRLILSCITLVRRVEDSGDRAVFAGIEPSSAWQGGRMRQIHEPQLQFGQVPIEELRFVTDSRDDTPAILRGLQQLYCTPSVYRPVMALLEKQLLAKVNARTSRPGLDL